MKLTTPEKIYLRIDHLLGRHGWFRSYGEGQTCYLCQQPCHPDYSTWFARDWAKSKTIYHAECLRQSPKIKRLFQFLSSRSAPAPAKK